MTCCGGKRAALRARIVAAAAPSEPEARSLPAPIEDEPQSAGGVVVEYQGHEAVLLRGGASGRLYTFSAGRRVRRLPKHDAQQVLLTPLFRRGEQ